MGMILAVKRSYRHFLPRPFFSPRKFVRRWYVPLFFYVVGLFTGMYVHPSEPERITYYASATMGALLLVKWWSKASAIRGGLDPASKVAYPKRPDNFTGLWINRHGVNARTEQHYVDGVANGTYRSILENGVLHREGYKKEGLWHGILIVRNSSGEVLDRSEFVEGTGIYRIFNSAGQMSGLNKGDANEWHLLKP